LAHWTKVCAAAAMFYFFDFGMTSVTGLILSAVYLQEGGVIAGVAVSVAIIAKCGASVFDGSGDNFLCALKYFFDIGWR